MLSGSEEAACAVRRPMPSGIRRSCSLRKPLCLALIPSAIWKDLAVYDRDLSGTLKHDKQAKELVKNAASNCGLDLPYASIYIGACDAAAFTQIGVKATGFAAMDPTPAALLPHAAR